MRKLITVILFLLPAVIVYCQENTPLSKITSQYESFEYRSVINLSEQVLTAKDSLIKDDVLNILLMKAVSHYALSEEDKARKCFIDMLKTDRTFFIDAEKISPKIVKLFADVRDDYIQSVPVETKKEPVKEVIQPVQINYPELFSNYKFQLEEHRSSVIRSFIFPGWGHMYSGQTLKGSAITSAALLNTGVLVYFIFDANKKQKDYLAERNPGLISTKYSSYNKSYVTRNILISSLILIYTYTQLDFLVINPISVPDLDLGLNPIPEGLGLTLKYSF